MYDTQEIWDFLSGIPIGTIVACCIVIGIIVSSICAGTIKLYKVFSKYKEAKDKIEEQKELIKNHDDTLQEIRSCLKEMKKCFAEQKEINLKQTRHTIVHTCEDALDKGEISINKLRSLEEMFDEYTEIFHANGYVKTLVMKVRKLKITGIIDEKQEIK